MIPIAHIENDFPTKFGIPRQSGRVGALKARIVFEPEYRNVDAFRLATHGAVNTENTHPFRYTLGNDNTLNAVAILRYHVISSFISLGFVSIARSFSKKSSPFWEEQVL